MLQCLVWFTVSIYGIISLWCLIGFCSSKDSKMSQGIALVVGCVSMVFLGLGTAALLSQNSIFQGIVFALSVLPFTFSAWNRLKLRRYDKQVATGSYYFAEPELQEIYLAIEHDQPQTVIEKVTSLSKQSLNSLGKQKMTLLNISLTHLNNHRHCIDIATILLKHGADPNIYDYSPPPLHQAIQNSHVPLVKLLISHGADINHIFARSHPLEQALWLRSWEIAELLMNHPEIDLSSDKIWERCIELCEEQRKVPPTSPHFTNFLNLFFRGNSYGECHFFYKSLDLFKQNESLCEFLKTITYKDWIIVTNHCLTIAKTQHLTSERSLITFALHMLTINPEFYKQTDIEVILKRTEINESTRLQKLIDEISDLSWEEASKMVNSASYWTSLISAAQETRIT